MPSIEGVYEDRKAENDSAIMATADEDAQYAAYQRAQYANRVQDAFYSILKQEGRLQVDGVTYLTHEDATSARWVYAEKIVDEALAV